MDKSEEEFLEKLKATFKLEAAEHIQTISSGLLDLDKGPDPKEKALILETIYREAHSLKGAARAVSLRDVEKICQSIETVLSLLKKGEIQPETSILDSVLDSIEAVSKLVSSDDVLPIGDLLQRLANISSGTGPHPNNLDQKHLETLSNIRPSAPTPEAKPVSQAVLQKEDIQQRQVTVPPNAIEPTSKTTVKPKSESKGLSQSETIRIKTSKLDSLLYQVEEMVAIKMAANQRVTDMRQVKASLDSYRKHWSKTYPEARIMKNMLESPQYRDALGSFKSPLAKILSYLDSNEKALRALDTRIKTLTSMAENDSRQATTMVDDLLDDMKSVLMLPSSTLLEIVPRLVRDLARDQKKSIKLTLDGGDTELDRRILEEMKDPLIHLVRNSVDHGMEEPSVRTHTGKPAEGSLSISISQLGAKKAQIIVSDDGQGIDVAKVKQSALRKNLISEQEIRGLSDEEAMSLIFRSEVSTSPIITDLSGRGLGLAIVREKVDKLGGTLQVNSILGSGTTFRIQLPVTLATFRGTLVKVESEIFVIPTANVLRVGRVKKDLIQTVENRDTIEMNGRVLSLVRLADVLEMDSETGVDEELQFVSILVLGASDQQIAYSVDAILNEQEVLVKNLGRQLSRVRNVSAGTVLGSGQVALILNVSDLILSAMRITGPSLAAHTRKSQLEHVKKSILVVEDSITSRMLLKNILESAGYEVQTAVDGVDAWTILKTNNFDVVVSDIEMPRMDGFELTSKIRTEEKFKNLPVVIVTSLESREDKERGIDVGANAYIVKSGFEQNNLLSVIRRLI
ncbi:MAG: hybrid sensor histidine kinase/response regulator [Desulfomonilaceae bacterium]|jgi:two-component system chemotaxis sensor kinase CheA